MIGLLLIALMLVSCAYLLTDITRPVHTPAPAMIDWQMATRETWELLTDWDQAHELESKFVDAEIYLNIHKIRGG